MVADIERTGGAAIFLKADLSSLAGVRCLANAVQHATDRLDILINNAGSALPAACVSRAAAAMSCGSPSIISPAFC